MPKKQKINKKSLIKNYKPTIDYRDYAYTANLSTLPMSASLKPYSGAIENQLSTGSCAAHATVSALEIMLQRDNKFKDLSRLFVYWNLREPLERKVDGGGFVRNALKAVADFGACAESIWPFNILKVNLSPDMAAYDDGKKLKVLRYESCGVRSELSIKYMKAAIAEGYPVIIGMSVSNQIFTVSGPIDSHKYDGINADNSNIIGGHAMCIVGYDDSKSYFIVENSWGDSWGDHGFMALSYDVAMHDISEAFVAKAIMGVTLNPLWVPSRRATKTFLDANDVYIAANNDENIYGSTGTETVILKHGVSGIYIDQNIEELQLPLYFHNYGLLQTGNLLNIYETPELVVKVPIRSSGTRIVTADTTTMAKIVNDQIWVGNRKVSDISPM